MKYQVIVRFSEEEQGYIATAPALEGCSAFGETYEVAAHEITTAMQLWLDVANERNIPIPEPEVVTA